MWRKTAKTPCYPVLPDDEPKIEQDSCPVSVGADSTNHLEKLSESDGYQVATSLRLKLQTEDPKENTMKELQCYITEVKQFDFNHIIIIGKRYCGLFWPRV
ncbi:8640_t:CDS:2 [Diversispora eburnea]|uniref:8640_t:CDS:1 n=1 Tax=Diversispora eburnea TaxID=1213867 RepID=A0A9N8V5W3_9GLOM|nr:8640_t:CDS:2 [Diversispora eburnea]